MHQFKTNPKKSQIDEIQIFKARAFIGNIKKQLNVRLKNLNQNLNYCSNYFVGIIYPNIYTSE